MPHFRNQFSDAAERVRVGNMRNPVIWTGRTRKRWFFWTQYEYEGPVYVDRWQTPFNIEQWPRATYWISTPPPSFKPRIRIPRGSRQVISHREGFQEG